MKKFCETCNNNHYIFTFDTKSNEEEIQKCDDCNVFKTDKEALKYVIKGLKEINFYEHNNKEDMKYPWK